LNRLISDDFSIAQDDHAFGEPRDIEFVGDHDDGDALIVQLLEYTHDLDAGLGVQISSRFIGQEQGGPVHQSAGDGYALLLAARKLVWMMIGAFAEADEIKSLLGAIPLFVRGDAVAIILHGHLDIFESRRAGQQIETLKDEADLFIADIRQRITIQRGYVNAIQPVMSTRRMIQRTHHIHDGRFAGTAGTHDGDEFAGHDIEGHTTNGVDIHFTGVIRLVDLIQLDDGVGRHDKKIRLTSG